LQSFAKFLVYIEKAKSESFVGVTHSAG